MRFKDITGNEVLKQRLASMVDQGRIGHAIMLTEEEGWGGLPIALALAQYMSCQNRKDGDSCGECPECNKIQKLIHPDMHFAFPVNVSSKSSSDKKPVSENFLPVWRKLVAENPYFTEEQLNKELEIEEKVGVISVAESKEILSAMNLRSYEGGNKYMIIWLPERMTQEAANKLLKIIEEPFPNTYFFLITHAPERVIKTIASRCLNIFLMPIDTSAISGKSSPYFPIITNILRYSLSKNLSSLIPVSTSIAEIGREKQKDFCKYSESFIRKIMMVRNGVSSIAVIPQDEIETINEFAKKLPDTFYEKAYSFLEEARISIESNVSAKIVFLNLINLIYSTV